MLFELYDVDPDTNERFPVVVASDGGIQAQYCVEPTLLSEATLAKAIGTLLGASNELCVFIVRISPETLAHRRQWVRRGSVDRPLYDPEHNEED